MNVTDVPNVDVPPVDELTAVAVDALVTVWTKFADPMPVNTAVMVYVPTVPIIVVGAVRVAKYGLLLFSNPVPIDAPPLWNVTVPAGVPLAPVTVAVNITGWPYTDVPLVDEVTVTVVELTTRSISPEVVLLKLRL